MIVLKSCWYNNTLFFPVSPIGTFSVKVKESTNKHKCNRCGLYLMKSNQTVKYFFFLFKINSQVPLEEVTPLLKCSPVVKPTSVIKYDLNRTLRGLGEGRECFCLGTLDYFSWEGIFSQAKTVSDWLLQPIISGLRKFLDWLISWEEAYGSP